MRRFDGTENFLCDTNFRFHCFWFFVAVAFDAAIDSFRTIFFGTSKLPIDFRYFLL